MIIAYRKRSADRTTKPRPKNANRPKPSCLSAAGRRVKRRPRPRLATNLPDKGERRASHAVARIHQPLQNVYHENSKYNMNLAAEYF
jgi:hypothetical protein